MNYNILRKRFCFLAPLSCSPASDELWLREEVIILLLAMIKSHQGTMGWILLTLNIIFLGSWTTMSIYGSLGPDRPYPLPAQSTYLLKSMQWSMAFVRFAGSWQRWSCCSGDFTTQFIFDLQEGMPDALQWILLNCFGHLILSSVSHRASGSWQGISTSARQSEWFCMCLDQDHGCTGIGKN